MQHGQFGAPRFLGEHFVVVNFDVQGMGGKKRRDFDDTRSVAGGEFWVCREWKRRDFDDK